MREIKVAGVSVTPARRTTDLFEGQIVIVVGAVCAMFLGLGVLTVRSLISFETSTDRMIRTLAIGQSVERLMTLTERIETGQRGFIITGDDAFLKPYLTAVDHVESNVNRAKALMHDDPRLLARIDRLADLLQARMAFADKTIGLRRSQGFEAATNLLRTGKGSEGTDEIWTIVNEIKGEEHDQLSRQSVHARTLQTWTLALIGTGCALSLAFAVGIGLVHRRVLAGRRSTEEALQSTLAKQDFILRAMPIVTYSAKVAEDYGAFWVSDNVEQMSGFSNTTFVQNKQFWAMRLHPEDRERTMDEFGRVVRTGSLTTTYRWQVAEGSYRWFMDRAVLVRHPDGTAKEIVGLWTDVTEQKEAEARFQETYDRLTALIEAAPIGIVIVDLDGICRLWNPAAQRIFGWTEAEVVGNPLPIVPSEKRDEHRALRERVLQNDAFTDLEVVRQNKAGDRLIISLSTAPLRDHHGAINGLFGLMIDVTEKKRAEGQLLRQAQMMDQIHDAVVSMDVNGVVESWNKGAERLFGYSAEEAVGRGMAFLYLEADQNVLQHDVIEPLLKKGVHETEVRAKKRSGEVFFIHLALSVMKDEKGVVTGMIAYSLDITERKQAEARVKQSRDQLRALATRLETVREDERARIAREIHDELGQALTSLKLDVSWIARRLAGSDTLLDKAKVMTRVQDMLGQLDGIIESVREIATSLRPGVLDELGLTAALDWQARDFEKRTGTRCDLTMPPVPIPIGPDQATAVFRIFQELLTNIARHAHATSVRVILTVTMKTLVLKVSDNGRGITDDEMANRQSLGLLGMRERAAQWGGDLSIWGEPGKGTIVTVRMPLASGER
ncbi:MAG: PAS domain S-box protein [Nitrospiraceae bacterium]